MPVTIRLPLAEAVRRLETMRVTNGPAVLRAIAKDAYAVGVREGNQTINGGVLARTGPNAALARYWTATMTMTATVDDRGIRGGLPANDLNARILAHRETGGTIRMKDKYLRIPLGPARTAAGFDRYDGVNLKARLGTLNPFFVFKAKTGNVFLASREAARTKPPKLVLWYLLRAQVTQKPHPWFSTAMKTLHAQLPEIVARRLPGLEA